jgi:hypothetical protein
MMRRTAHHAKPQMTQAQSMVQLKVFLAGCTDEVLAGLTVDTLAPRFKVQRREVECVLLDSQDSRRRFLARRAG